jgi:hypothetical protein
VQNIGAPGEIVNAECEPGDFALSGGFTFKGSPGEAVPQLLSSIPINPHVGIPSNPEGGGWHVVKPGESPRPNLFLHVVLTIPHNFFILFFDNYSQKKKKLFLKYNISSIYIMID